MLLAQRLEVPEHTAALLWDMDGVLIDSLAQDYAVVGPLLASVSGHRGAVPNEVVRRWFPLALEDFWAKLAADLGVALSGETLAEVVRRHERARQECAPIVHDGISEILAEVRRMGLRSAVVSNNPRSDVADMLRAAGLLGYCDLVVGNDRPGLARKPAPDQYLAAATDLGVPPSRCVAIEDSLLGLESAHRAGCHTVGVATGAATIDSLVSGGYADRCYLRFAPCRVRVTEPTHQRSRIETPDRFVDELLELMVRGMGLSLELSWPSDDWRGLGAAVGRALRPRLGDMMSVGLQWRPGPAHEVVAFLSAPVSSVVTGPGLADVLDGLAQGAQVAIAVDLPAAGDVKRRWVDIYRAVGTVLDPCGERGGQP